MLDYAIECSLTGSSCITVDGKVVSTQSCFREFARDQQSSNNGKQW